MFCMTFCVFVQDMKKFGGPNKMRQKCRLRQCLVKSRVRIFFDVVKFDVIWNLFTAPTPLVCSEVFVFRHIFIQIIYE